MNHKPDESNVTCAQGSSTSPARDPVVLIYPDPTMRPDQELCARVRRRVQAITRGKSNDSTT